MNRAQIGAALRALRLASGKEAKAVARSALMSPSKLSKIENARLAPSATDVDRVLSAIGVSDEVKAEYTDAARAWATEAAAWRLLKRVGVHKGQQAAKALEAQMSTLQLFQPALVPGLLQTPEYIRAVLKRHDLSEDALARTISGRLERQAVLYDSAKSLQFIITEPVLRWRIVPPQMMAAQLDRITSLSRLPHVDIRVVPLAIQQQDIANHAFVIRDGRMVTIETVHAEVVVTDPRDVDLYVEKFNGFASVALSNEKLHIFLEGIRDDFLRERETG
ncbi:MULTISPECIES: helix-turn-helix domain-containing protein [Streptomyces]|uniref:helix-turn-helix domain-containing protein n=1 Tax=Streptomyces TaxID=1883 RepID=UPI00099DED45|nr:MULTISPECIES: helix-turn-helix transcriptional regulator [Streptomyces]MCX4440659.1 helix-turn-helix domain-containing protein [Streptomyces albidoflavus]NEC98552.1 helix-turn-helix domain-containing protein [Streptomyces albidoflavus]RZE58298.1 XRE family transcriptional regulator [Streptomyces albidoflavus]WQG71674.1 helix-turn-helix transcriptional regulator [Streptomyces albidoflavus]WSD55042.1 helix-turn-helix domain-containing protein [Streptomyces albidoflavus]